MRKKTDTALAAKDAKGDARGPISKELAFTMVGVFMMETTMLGFIAPLFTILWASSNDHALFEALGRLTDAIPFGLWGLAASYTGWALPAAIIGGFSVFAGAGILVYAMFAKDRRVARETTFGPEPSKTNAKGSAGVYCRAEIIEGINETWDGDLEKGRPPYGTLCIGYLPRKGKTPERMVLAPKGVHTLTAGMTGAGKTTYLNDNSIYLMYAGGASAIVLDTKKELYGKHHLWLRRAGAKVLLVDFRDPEKSMGVNFLKPITDVFFAKKAEYDARMERAIAIAKEAGVPTHKMAQDSAWKDRGKFLEFRRQVMAAEAARKVGWDMAEAKARDMALSIVPKSQGGSDGAAHWQDVARELLQGAIIYVAIITKEDIVGNVPFVEPYPEQRNMASVVSLIREYGLGNARGVDLKDLFGAIDEAHPAYRAFSQLRASSDREYQTTVSEALKYLNEMFPSSIMEILTRSDIDFGAIGEEQTFLFLVVPSERPAAGRMFVALFDQIHQSLIERAQAHGGSLPVNVNYLLEELPAVCKANRIENLLDILFVGRSYNITCHITCQNLAQLKSTYREDYTSILDNCGVKVLVKTSDVEVTAKYFSESIGKYTYRAASDSRTKNALSLLTKTGSKSYREEERYFYTPDEITRLPESYGLLVLQSKAQKKPTWKLRRYGYNGTLKPLQIPARPAYDTKFGQMAGFDTIEGQEALFMDAAQEIRSVDRVPCVEWAPDEVDAAARLATREQIFNGGVSKSSRARFSRMAHDQKVMALAQEMLSHKVSAQEVIRAKDTQAARIVKDLMGDFRAAVTAAAQQMSDEESPHVLHWLYQTLPGLGDAWFCLVDEMRETGEVPAWWEEYAAKEPTDLYAIASEVARKGQSMTMVIGESQEVKPPLKKPQKGQSPVKEDKAYLDEMRKIMNGALRDASSPMEFLSLIREAGIIATLYPGGERIGYALEGKGNVVGDKKLGKNFGQASLAAYYEKSAIDEAVA